MFQVALKLCIWRHLCVIFMCCVCSYSWPSHWKKWVFISYLDNQI